MPLADKLAICLYLICFNATYLFRSALGTTAVVLVAYGLWFISFDTVHEYRWEAAYDFLSMLMAITTALFVTDVLNIAIFVPPANFLHARGIDSWTLFMGFKRVVAACAATTALALGWLFWDWRWSFVIISLLYAVVIGASFVVGYVANARRDTQHIVWLLLTLWQVFFFGAAQQIDPSVSPFVWIVVITMAPVVLAFVVLALNVFSPSVATFGGGYELVAMEFSAPSSNQHVILPATYRGGAAVDSFIPFGFRSADGEPRYAPAPDPFSASSMLSRT